MCALPALCFLVIIRTIHISKITLGYRENTFLTLKSGTIPQSWVIKADENAVKSNGFNLAMGLINALATLGSLPAVKLFRGRHSERTLAADSPEALVSISDPLTL